MYFMQEIEWLIVRLADAGMQVSTRFCKSSMVVQNDLDDCDSGKKHFPIQKITHSGMQHWMRPGCLEEIKQGSLQDGTRLNG